ncbi:MAG: hypothetical protein ACI9VR_003657 [Cognaticolwellia sp.]|jgi:hypothetical protein
MGAFRYAPPAQWPSPARLNDPDSLVCRLLFDVDAKGKTRQVRVFDCPDDFQAAALKATKFWTWTRFNIPNEPDPQLFAVDVPFKDERFIRYGHGTIGDPALYRPAEVWREDYARYPRDEVRPTTPQICWARFSLDAHGHTTDVVVDSQCLEPFADAAMKILPNWRFFQAQWAGEPVPSIYMTPIEFH